MKLYPIDVNALEAMPLPQAMSEAIVATQVVIPMVSPSRLIEEMAAINHDACEIARAIYFPK